MKVAFITTELTPFAKTGGLADVSSALPLELEKLGIAAFIFVPFYRVIKKIDQFDEENAEFAVKTIGKNIKVYFLKNDQLFDRDGIYGNAKGDYPDNLERFSYLCSHAIELSKKLNLQIDIFHCHDWLTSLVSVFLKTKFKDDSYYSSSRSVLTIHNLAYQGNYPLGNLNKIGLKEDGALKDNFEIYDQMNVLKSGIIYSDKITTVSVTYAKEILKKQNGCGLDEVLKKRTDGVLGILNGIDYDFWNPESDKFLSKKFNQNNLEIKRGHKQRLQKSCGFKDKSEVPLFGFVGRLAYQKGLDLMDDTMGELLKLNVQLIFQGEGDQKYQDMLEKWGKLDSKKIKSFVKFDEECAHQIYAGCDFFLMPSVYEPCGLGQMISFRYGTVPVCYKTGGLADTVFDYDPKGKTGNGIVFDKYKKEDFINSMERAIELYKSKDEFENLINKAFNEKFDWTQAALEYKKLYEECLQLD